MGMVYDSISRGPLRGATVQIVMQSAGARVYTAQADSAGRFIIENVPPGRYLAGFFHFALDSLGLEPPVRMIEVGGSLDQQRVILGTPSARTVSRALCGRASGDSIGALYTRVLDARTGDPVAGATVIASWQEMVNSGEAVRHEAPELDARSNGEGWAVVCGLPGGVPVSARVVKGADTSGIVSIRVPANGFLRRDLRLGGAARVSGVVRNAKGAALPRAMVRVAGREVVTRTDSSGTFTLPPLPAGSHTIEARAIGYASRQGAFEFAGGEGTQSADITLDSLPIPAGSVRSAAHREEFAQRRSAGAGTFLDARDVERLKPFAVSDLFRGIAGAAVSDQGLNHVVTFAAFGGRCVPALILDDVAIRMDEGTSLDRLVQPEDVEGVEAYTREADVPAPFRERAADCGVIVIWTGRLRRQ